MLAPILALHLLAAQTPPASGPPATPAQGADNPYEQTPPPEPPRQPAPPAKPAQPGEPAAPAPSAAPFAGQLSLLSAEPLRGNAAMLAWAGWSSLGVAYAQGITQRDDLGAFLDLDYAKTEYRLGAFYRRPLGTAGPFDMAGRLGLAWFISSGKTWFYSENHYDRGVELSPALVFSMRGVGGVFSLAGELPLVVTVKYDGGLLFSPRVAASYEAPLYEELTIGVRAALGYRAGSGDAPLGDGRGEVQFLVLAGYRVL